MSSNYEIMLSQHLDKFEDVLRDILNIDLNDLYKANSTCTNCGFSKLRYFKRGEEKKKLDCPDCGVKESMI